MAEAVAQVERARELYEKRAWRDAYDTLSAADREGQLGAPDLERLATAAYMLGREEEYYAACGRAHQAFLDRGEALAAARAAFWVGVNLAQKGEMARAGGWLARAQRLVEREGEECVEQGYLLMPKTFELAGRGDLDAAIATAAEAVAIGERFGEADLVALAGHEQGELMITRGQVSEGVALLDEAMLSVATGELSPIPSGIVYCGVILACQAAYDLRRAAEWTAALSEWCEAQPDMVAFTGRCLVHRTEIMRLRGAWEEALTEAQRASERCIAGNNQRAAGEAEYLQGEIHRLQGDLAAAEAAYRAAGERGREPQPGLALLRLAEGDTDAAAAAIRRALTETATPPDRAAMLPAQVEIALATGDVAGARAAADELREIATGFESAMLAALAEQAEGTVGLAQGEPERALVALRNAVNAWLELDAPYETARARALVARACRALGDEDAAEIELEAARGALAALGAEETVAEPGEPPPDTHGLTARELEVLRLVAAGSTNKAIAAELVLSERTIERHVSNICAKLDVSSRTAATSFAYEHGIV